MKKLTDKGYRGYLRALDAKIDKLREHGVGEEYIPSPLTRREWEYQYTATRNDLKEAMESGDRKVIGNVNQYMISSQVYETSRKHARAILEAFRTLKDEGKITKEEMPKQEQLMLGSVEPNWDILKELYHDKKDQFKKVMSESMASANAKKYISTYYFGSK